MEAPASQDSTCDDGTSRFGVCGLIVPAYTTRPSSSLERANILASASVPNVLVSRGLRCLAGCHVGELQTSRTRSAYLYPAMSPLGGRGGSPGPNIWSVAARCDRIFCMRLQSGIRSFDVDQEASVSPGKGPRPDQSRGGPP